MFLELERHRSEHSQHINYCRPAGTKFKDWNLCYGFTGFQILPVSGIKKRAITLNFFAHIKNIVIQPVFRGQFSSIR